MLISMEKRRDLILNGNLWHSIILLTIPTLIMTLLASMISFTDGLFLNNIIGAKRVAAITYVQPAIGALLGLSQGLGVAAMAIIGQTVGKGDTEGVKHKSVQILMLSIFMSILLIPVSFGFAFFLSVTAPVEMQNDILVYVILYSFVLPLQFLAAIFNSIKNSVGNPEAPFYRMLVLLILKIFFNYIFLNLLRFEVKGAVYASLFAYIVTGIWMYYDLFVKKYLYTLSLKGFKIDKPLIRETIRISIPSMLNYMMMSLGFLLINFEMRKYGQDLLAAIGIAGYFNAIIFQAPASVSIAITTVISLNIGIKNVKKAKKAYSYGIVIVLLVALLGLILMLPFLDFYIDLFTRDEIISKIAKEGLKIYAFSIVPFSIFTVSQAVLNALGRNIIPLIMSFSRIWLFRYIFIKLTEDYIGYSSFFYGNFVSNFLAGAIFVIIILNIKWETGINE
ncbi:MATE family efflux transporter [Oceanivirga miroungae]|uniref:Multidrug-efflux transporter n=1 Tax=Oceanivirga miroungae TaxID=1130046 RepID=A0A6I8ME54_9FUSO|nr:MATE family efflux transporter [Oceanivirga miroungae]VWL85745.1 hypothetical protein OMES3154_01033 [Oceanivirga miroungae]